MPIYSWVKNTADFSAQQNLDTRKDNIMNWKNMPISHKIATIISALAALVWAIQQVKPDLFPINLSCPAIALFTGCEAVVCWKNQRTWSYLLIAGAVISIACFILEFML